MDIKEYKNLATKVCLRIKAAQSPGIFNKVKSFLSIFSISYLRCFQNSFYKKWIFSDDFLLYKSTFNWVWLQLHITILSSYYILTGYPSYKDGEKLWGNYDLRVQRYAIIFEQFLRKWSLGQLYHGIYMDEDCILYQIY